MTPELLDVVRIAARGAGVMPVMRDGGARAWASCQRSSPADRICPGVATPMARGANTRGQLGTGTAAVTRDARVLSWGNNEQGVLGHDTQEPPSRLSP